MEGCGGEVRNGLFRFFQQAGKGIKVLLICPGGWYLFGRFSAGRKSQEFLRLFNLVVQVKVDFTGSGKEASYEAN